MYINLLFGILLNVVFLLVFSRFFSKNMLRFFVISNFCFLVFLSLYSFIEVGFLNEIVLLPFHT